MPTRPSLKTLMTPFPYAIDVCRSFGEYLRTQVLSGPGGEAA